MDKYHLSEQIGTGKYSKVYKARQRQTIDYVAAKSVEKFRKPKIMNEVQILVHLNHPNVLKFHTWYETSNHYWLIVDYCTGGDLLTLLHEDGKLPESSVVPFVRDIANALQYIHAKSVIFCDLKPSNVLLDGSGALKLFDFGLAARLKDLASQAAAGSKQRRGTPCYMAPELFSDFGVYSFASDLWALGCVIVELATGEPPFVGANFSAVVDAVLERDCPVVPGASPTFQGLVRRLLEKDPAKRITWVELCAHPIWTTGVASSGQPLPVLPLPPQPRFDESLAAFAAFAASTATESMPATPPSATVSSSRELRRSIDMARLSSNARLNKDRDRDHAREGAPKQAAASSELPIEDWDEELDFTENQDAMEDTGSSRSTVMSTPRPQRNAQGARVEDSSFPAAVAGPEADEHPTTSTTSAPSGTPRPGTAAAANTRPATGTEHGAGDTGTQEPAATGLTPLDKDLVEKYLYHATDLEVKPIVLNKKIEKTPVFKFDESQIKFPIKTPEELVAMAQEEGAVETFLTQLYKSVSNANAPAEAVNALKYFQTLSIVSDVADMIINSTLMALLVKLLKKSKLPNVQSELAFVIGLLVRHASFITKETLPESNMLAVLTETLRDSTDEAVRRRVAAALGELVFYVASQSAAEPDEEWAVPGSTVVVLTNCLKENEDEIVQHYAIKTIENVCVHAIPLATQFATRPVATQLVHIFAACTNESARASAAAALARVVRTSKGIAAPLVEQAGVGVLTAGLCHTNARIKQCYLTVLCLALVESPARVQNSILDDKTVISCVMDGLSDTTAIVRGKSLAALYCFTMLSPLIAVNCCEMKLMPTFEKLAKDAEVYVVDWWQNVASGMLQVCGELAAVLATELVAVEERRNPPPQKMKEIKWYFVRFRLSLYIVGSALLRSRLLTPRFIQDLSVLVSQGDGLNTFDARDNVLSIVESLPQNQSTLLANYEACLGTLLPSLVALLGSPTVEGRFTALRIFSSFAFVFLTAPELYLTESERGQKATHLLNQTLVKGLLPACAALLADGDATAAAVLKLLSVLLARNPAFVGIVARLNLVPLIVQAMGPSTGPDAGSRVSANHLTVISSLIASDEIDNAALLALDLPARVAAVLAVALAHNADELLDASLNAACGLLLWAWSLTAGSRVTGLEVLAPPLSASSPSAPNLAALNPLAASYVRVLGVLGHAEVTQLALQYVLATGSLLSAQVRPLLLSEAGLDALLACLRIDNPTQQALLLRSVAGQLTSSAVQATARAAVSAHGDLARLLLTLGGSSDRAVAEAAQQLRPLV